VAGRDVQGDVLEHRLVVDITEAHVVEADRAVSPLGQCDGIRAFNHIGFLIQELGHALSPGHSVLDVLPCAAQRSDGLVEDVEV